MNQISNLSAEIIDRALESLAGEIPALLLTELKAIQASGTIHDSKAVAAAISKAAETGATDAH